MPDINISRLQRCMVKITNTNITNINYEKNMNITDRYILYIFLFVFYLIRVYSKFVLSNIHFTRILISLSNEYSYSLFQITHIMLTYFVKKQQLLDIVDIVAVIWARGMDWGHIDRIRLNRSIDSYACQFPENIYVPWYNRGCVVVP